MANDELNEALTEMRDAVQRVVDVARPHEYYPFYVPWVRKAGDDYQIRAGDLLNDLNFQVDDE